MEAVLTYLGLLLFCLSSDTDNLCSAIMVHASDMVRLQQVMITRPSIIFGYDKKTRSDIYSDAAR